MGRNWSHDSDVDQLVAILDLKMVANNNLLNALKTITRILQKLDNLYLCLILCFLPKKIQRNQAKCSILMPY